MKYFISIFCFLSFSCNQISESWKLVTSDNEEKSEEVKDSSTSHITLPLYITNVDQLRLRKYPDTKSGILTTLDENSILVFLNEQTDYKEHIGKHSAPWIKVAINREKIVGWVYGAKFFVDKFLSENQIDSIHKLKKEIEIFEHKTRRDMNDLTGANWGSSIPGTRFSGYFSYNESSTDKIPDGNVVIRARIFDIDNKKVKFVPCILVMDNGMPMSDVTCLE